MPRKIEKPLSKNITGELHLLNKMVTEGPLDLQKMTASLPLLAKALESTETFASAINLVNSYHVITQPMMGIAEDGKMERWRQGTESEQVIEDTLHSKASELLDKNKFKFLEWCIQAEHFDHLWFPYRRWEQRLLTDPTLQEHVWERITACGFDRATIAKLWRRSRTAHSANENETLLDAENAIALLRLEHRLPHSTRTLNNEFGISCFALYPEKVLLAQGVQEKSGKPFGVFLSCADDHSGEGYHRTEVLERFYDSLPEGYAVIIFEFVDGTTLSKRLLRAHDTLTPHASFQFGIMHIHGSETLLALTRKILLASKDIDKKLPLKIISLFSPDAPLLLIACEAGKDTDKGFAKELSRHTNGVVTGPDVSCHIDEVVAQVKDGTLSLKATYGGSGLEPVENRNPVAMQYKNGTRIT